MTHLNRKTCCGHTFTARDIQGRLMSQQEAFGTNDPHLYGGNAQRFAETQCPVCHTPYILWLKRQAPSFKVLTISEHPRAKPPDKKNEVEASNENASESPNFDDMDAKELRQWLKSRGVKFFVGAPEDELRELAKQHA